MSAKYLQNLFGLDGRVVVVFGGTGSLGGALCDGLAQAGALVIVAGRNPERGHQRVSAIETLGGQAVFSEVDVTSRSAVETLLQKTLERERRLDSVVNCAGINIAAPYFEVSDVDWDRIMETNLRSAHLTCQVFGKYMVQSGEGGSILNIGSVTSDRPLSHVFAYSASKAALVSLTQNIARELAPHGVRVNALCPGFFPTELNRKILDEERVTNIMRQTPMNRFGEPHELVGAALLLLSPTAGSFITGTAFYVDGGFTAMTF